MGVFSPRDAADVGRFVREEVLGLVTTHDEHGYIATPLPLLAELDEHGAVRGFVGHFALANRHVARAQAAPRAQVTFLGPHGYISPGMVSAPGWGPTWNYRFAQFEVELEFEPARGGEAIVELVTAMEGEGTGAWTVARMGERFEVLAKHVIAFRASVTGATAQFKLGQDETPQTFAEILDALGEAPLARAMRDQRDVGASAIPSL
ncbi:FMN-binding negative transcriptional regulator [Novosphingobium sp. AP12]|uniref:FMN-binding negative transcriptional regulator n=1 Tax=Novosphingobium sp. AP12 TaxID=1144305 RepID=UPI000271DD21|nr:FMN-binding negative transcriptional regulator [Novosphingobium sp. AP12]EJL33471.1 transcriptional regulator [Novosphingobium sp. AP12]